MESPAKLIRWLFDSGSGPPNRLIPRWIVLRALAAQHPELGIDGLTGHETNPDTTGVPIPVLPDADFQGQLDPDLDHHFPAVDLQIFGG